MAKIIKIPFEVSMYLPPYKKAETVRRKAWINPECVEEITPYDRDGKKSNLRTKSGRWFRVPLSPDDLAIALFPFGDSRATVRLSNNPKQQ